MSVARFFGATDGTRIEHGKEKHENTKGRKPKIGIEEGS
jgi:hypothetical protein